MAAPKIDVNFINPFIDGAIETFKVQCSFAAKGGKPFIKGQGPTIPVDITAIIALKSGVFNGSISICFPEPVFLAVMEKMLGEKYEKITAELEDGASELLNIIFGQAKKVLNQKGFAIEKAIPTVVRGKDMAVRNPGAFVTLVIPFETDLGIFHIEITTEP